MYFVSGLLRELTNAHLKFDNFTMRGSTLQMQYTGIRTALGISYVKNSTIEAVYFYIGDNFSTTIKQNPLYNYNEYVDMILNGSCQDKMSQTMRNELKLAHTIPVQIKFQYSKIQGSEAIQ